MRTHKVKNTPFVQLQMNWSALSLRRRILRKDNKKMGILDAGHLGPSCREGRLGIELICAATSAAVNSSTFPKHIALIMDGNARWARERGIPILEGYEAGVEALRRTLRASVERRIQCLTVYALSIENLQRSRGEVSELFMLIERVLIQNLEEMNRAGIRLRVVGDRKKWPSSLAQEVAR